MGVLASNDGGAMQAAAQAKPLVLCVEDDPTMAMLLIYNLEQAGFGAVSVDDGHAALRTIEQIKPDLVILDWTIPRLSGLQVLKYIRNSVLLDRVPVLMVTGRTAKEDRRLALHHGATAFFAKPFALAELISTVRHVVGAPVRVEGTVP
jgi:two-component system, OmpR family, phosphate regulon response regulator PhoB